MGIYLKTLFTYLAAVILLVNQVLAGTFSDGEHTGSVVSASFIYAHETVTEVNHADLLQDESSEHCDVHCHLSLFVQVPSFAVFQFDISQQSTPSFSLERYKLSRIAPPVPPPMG